MIKKLITLLVLATALASCSDDFVLQTDPNSVAASDYFRTDNDVLQAVNGVYQSLRGGNNIGENSGLYTDERSDDAGRNDNQSNAGEPFQFNDFAILPSNTNLKSHWLALYQTIARCNQVTSNIDKVTFTTPANKDIYNAEVKFVRGLIYFHLVRKWGDVPLVTKQLNSTDDVIANTFREKKEKVYEQIIADLKEAVASGLPNHQPVSEKGRVSKAAANALLGQVYLTMATTLDQANRASNLANAKTYLTAAYNMKTFTALKDIPYVDVFDVTKKSTNAEVIFQIVNKQGDITYSSSIAANNQAKGETTNSLKPSNGVGGNVKQDLVKEYESNDLRKDFSIKYANDATVKDWYITKFRDVSALASANGYGGNDWPLIRYADVILMLAEVNMYLGDEATAIQFLNQVRERAKMPTYEVMKNNPEYSAKFPTLKLAILHERRVELAFEHHRWFDLLRFFTPTELVAYIQSKPQSDYGTAKVSNFGLKDYLFPIPFDEYKLNPTKMYQNTGY